MKFLTMVTTSNPDEAGPPPASLMQAIEDLGRKAGPQLKDTGGMKTIGLGRVDGSGVVVDGPYAEAKEAVGGFAIYELESEAEALEWVRQFLDLHRQHWPAWQGEVTIRHLINYGP